ncbi:MotA/TolQ/ExbB proton channel family protein [Aliarcobacter cibarius]|uniref:Putative membrane protein n=1 Tax=Aliarcobacter cibarius TaxID=255507 RepID=A0A7L5JRG2_9BACT|nr:MotA/TolQ/ExbB proton channel family protein [Aliarcobacter cibarius]QKJ27807.1 putative membrane protein [Aliarcobacter cibarius]TLT04935.1 MotA/TolQ/ExbB proton channel family protein [Aliarcobacter cibarius]
MTLNADLKISQNLQSNCNTNSKFVTLLTVPVLLYLLVILCFIGVFPLKFEIHSIILIGFILLIYLFFVKHNAFYVACKFKTLYHDVDVNLKEYANKNQLTIGDTTKANGDVDDFLQDYTSNLRNSNFSSIASGIFPTLGILGTFISIAISMPDFSSGATNALESEITKLLGGVGTAFYVSIYGIFLSIWWTFFEKFGMSKFQQLSYKIKEDTKSLFWTKLDIESIHLKSNLDNFTKMREIFSELTSSNILESINSSIEKRFQNLENLLEKEILLTSKIDSNIENNERLVVALNSVSNSISNIISNFEKQKDRYTYVTEELNLNIIKLNTHMSNLSSENLKAIYSNIIKSIETMKADMEKIEWKFTQGLESYDNKIKNSLELIDAETSKIILDLTEFKELSK